MSIKAKQIAIVITFTLLSMYTYKLGTEMDYGTLQLSANVSNFNYTINNSPEVCRTANCSKILKSGVYNLELSKENFLPYSNEIRVEMDQTTNLDVSLVQRPSLFELKSEDFLPNYKVDQTTLQIFNPVTSAFEQKLALSPNQQIQNLSVDPQSESALVLYSNQGAYYYDFSANQSYKLILPEGVQVAKIKHFQNDKILLEATDGKIYQSTLSNQQLDLKEVKQFYSINHFQPLSNGYLVVMPTDIASGVYSLNDLVSDSLANEQIALDDSKIREDFKNLKQSLFFFSPNYPEPYKIKDLDVQTLQNTEIISAVSKNNSTLILKEGNRFYQIRL